MYRHMRGEQLAYEPTINDIMQFLCRSYNRELAKCEERKRWTPRRFEKLRRNYSFSIPNRYISSKLILMWLNRGDN